jgi:gamma-glutamylcyclotransferase (GGCT)/AIG2-like uncharacterized protein YtfP
MKEPVYLFVYGTLRKEFGSSFSNKYADEMEYVGEAKIYGELYDIGEYPGAIQGLNKDSTIAGELIRLRNHFDFVRILDQYENYDPLNTEESEYVRGKVIAMMDDGKAIEAWVYWYNQSIEGKTRIPDNNYLNYLKNKLRNSEA